MARAMGEKTKRAKTKKSLENALKNRKLQDDFLTDKVDEYMSFFDDLNVINSALIEIKSMGNSAIELYMKATSEKRRISSEMRNILRFLGLKPDEVEPPGGGDEDEEL